MVGQRFDRAGRGFNWRRAVIALFAVTLLASACGGSDDNSKESTDATTSPSTTAAKGGASATAEELTGPAKQATGTPVKVGVISDGRNPASDNSIEAEVA